MGYENAIWLLSALLDDAMYEGTGARLRDEDRVSVEKSECCFSILPVSPLP